MNVDPRALGRLPPKLAQALLAVAAQAAEHGVTVDLGVSVAVSRAEAGRLGGQRSAVTRTQRHGSAQPTAPPRSKSRLLAEAKPVCFEDSPKQEPFASDETPKQEPFASRKTPTQKPFASETKAVCFEPDAEGPRFPPLGSPSSDHSSYSALLRIPSSPLLASSEDLTGSARVHAPTPKPPKAPKQPTWRRVPGDWQPSPEHVQIAIAMAVDLQLEASKFRDHEFQRPKRDADATFRNWLRAAKPSPRPLNGAGHSATPRKYATVDDVDRMLGLK